MCVCVSQTEVAGRVAGFRHDAMCFDATVVVVVVVIASGDQTS